MEELSPAMILGLGERLRLARTARALTPEQAAVALRLDTGVVRALEEENFEVLGAPVFVQGHLKGYAKLLGLPEEEVLLAYRLVARNAGAPPRVSRQIERPLRVSPSPRVVLAVAVGALFIILLLVGFNALRSPTRAVVDGLPEALLLSTPELNPAKASAAVAPAATRLPPPTLETSVEVPPAVETEATAQSQATPPANAAFRRGANTRPTGGAGGALLGSVSEEVSGGVTPRLGESSGERSGGRLPEQPPQESPQGLPMESPEKPPGESGGASL